LRRGDRPSLRRKTEGLVTLTTIMVGGFISLIGIGLIMYGRKAGRVPHLAVGLILVVYPYFVWNVAVQIAVAVVLLLGLGLVSRLGY
jgi:hypothetical protein